ncbi:ATP-binding protein [Bacillus sp. N9]
MKIEKYKSLPLLLGALAFGLEFIGNSAEHLMRYWLLIHPNLGFQDWALLAGVALFRSYFVVGLYSSITVTEQKKRLQEMLEVGSELYAETLYLQKSINHIEQITASSHDLYRKLKQKTSRFERPSIAHHTRNTRSKKDSQRILSGISKISLQNNKEVLMLSDVLSFVVTANEKYCKLLRKEITVTLSLCTDFETDQQVPLLAFLNNLVANAIESIMDIGDVDLHVFEELTNIHFVIKDSGKGIPSADLSMIFEPGYTTKFNDQGVASTGIGLSHVNEIVHTLGGSIQVKSSKKERYFTYTFQLKTLEKELNDTALFYSR